MRGPVEARIEEPIVYARPREVTRLLADHGHLATDTHRQRDRHNHRL